MVAHCMANNADIASFTRVVYLGDRKPNVIHGDVNVTTTPVVDGPLFVVVVRVEEKQALGSA